MYSAIDDEKAGAEDGQHDIVKRKVIADVENTQHRSARDGLDAVLTAGEFGLYAEKEHHLRQGQGHHGEVDALATNGDGANDQAEQGGNQRTAEDGKLRC